MSLASFFHGCNLTSALGILTALLLPTPSPGGQDKVLALELGGNVKLEVVRIPAGKYLMGLAKEERGPDDPKDAQREVAIAAPSYLGKFEVTRGQFQVFVNATGHKMANLAQGWDAKRKLFEFGAYDWSKPGFEQTDDHPVIVVGRKDAIAFCAWLASKSGRTVRLPTEAEWEYACRAGSTTRYSFGDDAKELKHYANVADMSLRAKDRKTRAAENWDDGFPFTAPVGKFKPNAFGLHDMHGNVMEWCSDPQVPNSGAEIGILRGGNWWTSSDLCRSAWRLRTTTSGGITTGFRVLVEAAN